MAIKVYKNEPRTSDDTKIYGVGYHVPFTKGPPMEACWVGIKQGDREIVVYVNELDKFIEAMRQAAANATAQLEAERQKESK